jgi:MFS family permease
VGGDDQARVSTWRLVTRVQRRAIAASLASLALLFFDQTAVVVALPAIRQDFGASVHAAQWTVTANLLALALVMPLVGRLADRFGRHRLLLVGLATFGVASALCAVAPSLPALIALRFVMGLGEAVMQPMALSVGARGVPTDRRGWVIGFMSSGGSVFLVLGPLIASGLLLVGSWRLLFLVNLPVLVYVLVEMARVGPVSGPRGSGLPVRDTVWLLFALSATVVGVSQLAIWGPVAVAVLAVGVVVLTLVVRAQVRATTPVIPVRYLRDRRVAGSLVALFAIQFAVLATMVSLVAYLELGIGATAALSGLVVALTGLGSPLLSITTGRLADTVGPRRLVTAGLVAVTLGLGWCATQAESFSVAWLLPGLILFSLARPAVFTPASAAAMDAIPDEERPTAAGLVTESRQLGAVIGVSVAGVAAEFAGGLSAEEAADGFAAAIWTTALVTGVAAVVAARWVPASVRRT